MASTKLNTNTDSSYSGKRIFKMIDNYIYLYHTNTLIVVPSFVDSMTDTMPVHYQTSTPLSRSAPIFSYAGSGPRSLRVQFDLHRDMMTQINTDNSSILTLSSDDTSRIDYVDLMIKEVQAAAVPNYDTAQKMVNPPIIAVRLGNDIYIKGVVSGAVSVTYKYPILDNGKYSNVTVAFDVSEMDPYSAEDILKKGSFRYVSTDLQRVTYGTLSSSNI